MFTKTFRDSDSQCCCIENDYILSNFQPINRHQALSQFPLLGKHTWQLSERLKKLSSEALPRSKFRIHRTQLFLYVSAQIYFKIPIASFKLH